MFKMNELIKIVKTEINNELVNAVNARELHEVLEVKTKFSDWIKRRIDETMAEEGVDFICIGNKNLLFKKSDYFISIKLLKEILMLDKGMIGKKVRNYFIKNNTFNELDFLPSITKIIIDSSPKNDKMGYVYLIKSDNNYKIGISTNPIKRFKTIQSAIPFNIEIIHLIESCDYKKIERELHKKFYFKRINGEWFDLNNKDIEFIKSYK